MGDGPEELVGFVDFYDTILWIAKRGCRMNYDSMWDPANLLLRTDRSAPPPTSQINMYFRTIMTWLLLYLAALLTFATQSQGQVAGEVASPLVISAGAGAGSWDQGLSGDVRPIAAQLGAAYASPKGIFTLQATLLHEFCITCQKNDERVWDVGLLYGRRYEGRMIQVSGSAGLALVGGDYLKFIRPELGNDRATSQPPECENEDPCPVLVAQRLPFHTVGIPVNASILITPWKDVGFGLGLFSNLNGYRRFQGLTATVQVGIGGEN